MKIAAYTIAKNEAHNVQRWAQATSDCDYRLVLDTGSTDDTVEQLLRAGVTVVQKAYSTFRFDQARNDALALIPDNIDWLISPDMDECFSSNWRQELMATVQQYPDVSQVTYNMLVHQSDRQISGEEPSKKIHQRDYFWEQPVHEYLVTRRTNAVIQHNDKIILHHYQEPKDREWFYYQMAEEHIRTHPNNSYIMWFALRGAWLIENNDQKVIERAPQYLALTQPHTHMRSVAYCEYAKSLYRTKAESHFIKLNLLRAICEYPDNEYAWRLLEDLSKQCNDVTSYLFALDHLGEMSQEHKTQLFELLNSTVQKSFAANRQSAQI